MQVLVYNTELHLHACLRKGKLTDCISYNIALLNLIMSSAGKLKVRVLDTNSQKKVVTSSVEVSKQFMKLLLYCAFHICNDTSTKHGALSSLCLFIMK